MLVLLPLIRSFAHHPNRWVVLGAGVAMVGAAIGISAVGITTHQPAVTRIGVFLMLARIVYAVLIIRSRRARTDQKESRKLNAPYQANGPSPVRMFRYALKARRRKFLALGQ